MTRLALNKSSMAKQVSKLKLYNEVLPSLDLKRRQLLAAQGKARKVLKQLEKEILDVDALVKSHIPMLSNRKIDLEKIVTVEHFEILEENVVGVNLPRVGEIKLNVRSYPYLGKPHWVDFLVVILKQSIELHLKIQIAKKRVELLDKAATTYTQRFNLFEKVLIPKTKKNIKKIRIYLSDSERAALVNAKISKKKKGLSI